MARRPKDQKDRTSLVISIVMHVLLIGGIAYWAYKTGQIEKLRQAVLQYVKGEKKKEEEEQKPSPQRSATPTPQLPPINQGVPPTSSGTRRAVASDAPPSAGADTFFQDTRRQVQGPSTSGSGGTAPGPNVKTIATVPPPAPLPAFRAAPKTTIKQLLVERAKEAAATEAFGAEQISRSGVSDAGDILNKVAGASVVDGKFAVIRGLSDRYVTATLNGAEVPSADPYRRSASLDMFPAQIINKVVVAKTFTPDQPGSYTGGGINIVTKSFPERPFANFSIGTAYNTQSSFNDNFLTYPGGALDWLAMDDGTRDIAKELAAEDLVVPNPPFTSGNRNSSTYSQRIKEAEQLDALTKAMGLTEFRANRDAPPLNHNLGFSVGDTTHMFGNPLGVFAGLSYRRDFSFYEEATSRRYAPGGTLGSYDIRKDYLDTKAVEEVNWAGVVNLAYQPFENHELGFNFLFNQASEDLARHQRGTTRDDPGVTFDLNRLHFTERNLHTFQLKGAHHFPEVAGARLDWLGALSQTSQDEPDTRFFNFAEENGAFIVGKASSPDPKNPTRYFRDLDEENRNLKLDLTIPFRQWSSNEGEFKIGFFDSTSERTFLDREVYYQGSAVFDGDPNNFLNAGNLGSTATTNASTGRINYNWNRYIQTRDSDYTGENGIRAGYAMFDTPVVDRLRLITGFRYELTDLSIASRSYLPNSVTGSATNNSVMDEAHVLPAAGIVYALQTNMNVRLSYSQTVARPSFRELAGYRSYDPTLDELLDGNPNLQMSEIQNYDLRWEWFVRPGELFGISLFYKDLKNAIERRYVTIDGEIITFANRDKASVYGIEFEARKNLDFISPYLNEFSLGANLSFIQSEVELTDEEIAAKAPRVANLEKTRSLYDQSPYILNLDLNWDHPHSGTSATLLLNMSGPRVTIASLNTEDIYEQTVPMFDFILSQRIGRNMTVKFTAKNLLDPEIERTYGEDRGMLYSSYKRGRTFGLSINYDF